MLAVKEKLDPPGRAGDSVNGNSDNFVSNFLLRNGVSSFEADGYGFGAIAKETTANQVKNYNYRADGKISSFLSASLQVSYLYDGLDRLTAKLVNQNGNSYTQSFAHLGDGDGMLMGKAGDGSVTAYIDGKGIEEHLGEVKGGVAKAYITDHLGSVLNSSLTGFGRAYGLFGEVSATSSISPSSAPVSYGFTGHMVDQESGLNRTQNRQYDPRIGRWLSQEPTGRDGPNLYWYAKNSPQKYIDLDGLSSSDPTQGGFNPPRNISECVQQAYQMAPACRALDEKRQKAQIAMVGCMAAAGFAGGCTLGTATGPVLAACSAAVAGATAGAANADPQTEACLDQIDLNMNLFCPLKK